MLLIQKTRSIEEYLCVQLSYCGASPPWKSGLSVQGEHQTTCPPPPYPPDPIGHYLYHCIIYQLFYSSSRFYQCHFEGNHKHWMWLSKELRMFFMVMWSMILSIVLSFNTILIYVVVCLYVWLLILNKTQTVALKELSMSSLAFKPLSLCVYDTVGSAVLQYRPCCMAKIYDYWNWKNPDCCFKGA